MSEQIKCPCCRQAMPNSFGIKWDHNTRSIITPGGATRFTPAEARIVNALYRKSLTGSFDSLADFMDAVYSDDASGGPESTNILSVVLIKIRRKLAKVGWTVSMNIGRPRVGYRLVQLTQEAA